MKHNTYTIIPTEHPDPADLEAIRSGLEEFNLKYAVEGAFQPLTLLLRDPTGVLAGGLIGAIYWGWLYIEILWLNKSARGSGYGSALLAEAEQQALARGCHSVHLDTMDWQALPFYQRHGYTVWGQLDDLPIGHTRYSLKKRLSGDAA